jgi:hypothetical protein
MSKGVKRPVKRNSIYKSIFTIVEYEGAVIFMGELNFDGI